MQASWNKRIEDSTFDSFEGIGKYLRDRRANSVERVKESAQLRVVAYDDKTVAEGASLGLVSEDGKGAAALTHWTFGQLCSLAGANASFLRKLPAPLVVEPLNWCLKNLASEKIKVLLSKNGVWTARAISGPDYGRIFDAQILDDVLSVLDQKAWQPPVSFDKKGRASKLYASDRDMHLTLVNESNPIEVPGKNGVDTLFRGIIIGHSEVVKCKLWIRKFLYRYSCANRQIWATQDLGEISIRHSKNAPAKWAGEVMPMLNEFVDSPTAPLVELVKSAQTKTIAGDRDQLVSLLRGRGFTQNIANAAADRAEENADEANPRSVWGVVQAITSLAHDTKFQDDRIELEVAAGRLMEAA